MVSERGNTPAAEGTGTESLRAASASWRWPWTWARWQLPGLPAMPMLNSMNAFLQSQRIVRPSAVVALLSNFLVTVPLCWYLTQPGSLGFAGAPL